MIALTQPIMKQSQQEIPVESVELVLLLLLSHRLQAICEIVAVAIERKWRFCIEEALALDEIDEHQAVQHQRGIPFAVALRGDAGDELQESRVFKFEPIIEFLCDALNIESLCDAPHHFQRAQLIFFIDGNDQRFELLAPALRPTGLCSNGAGAWLMTCPARA